MAVVCPPLVERKARGEVVRASDEHADLQAEFYRAVWNKAATADSVRRARASSAASNPVEPGSEPPTFLFLSGDRVIGHVATFPVRFWNGRGELQGFWFNGLTVLPEFRNGFVAYSLLKEAVQRLPLTAALTVAASARRLCEGVGFADLGALGNYVTVLRPARVLRHLDVGALGIAGPEGWLARTVRLGQRIGLTAPAGAVASAALGLWRAATAPRKATAVCGAEAVSAVDLDNLWQRVRGAIAGSPVRDGRYLSWRYLQDSSYELAGVRDGRELVAAAVIRLPRAEGDARLRGIRVATLSDIVFPLDRPAAGAAAVASAEHVARRAGADAVLCSTSHRTLTAILSKRAYIPLTGNLHFMLRDPGGTHGLPMSLGNWWLTRGDASADQVF